MILKPQDILFLLKLVSLNGNSWVYNEIAIELGMSSSEVHAAVKRSMQAGLAFEGDFGIVPNIRNLSEFLIHGIQYVFKPEKAGLVRGMPTSYAAPPLSKHFVKDNEPPPVWPDPEGLVRGLSFSPLYKSAPHAATRDGRLYELLVMVDAIRDGRAREKDMAIKILKRYLDSYDLGHYELNDIEQNYYEKNQNE